MSSTIRLFFPLDFLRFHQVGRNPVACSHSCHPHVGDQSIVCLSLSHQTTPVELRERVRLAPAAGWRSAMATPDQRLRELVVLSTCQRTELYAVVDDGGNAGDQLIAFLEQSSAVPASAFAGYAQCHHGLGAAEHLSHVACGLDSRVLGESEILGQVGAAYTQAVEECIVGPVLSAVFRTALRAGKRVRYETSIGRNPASVGSAALAMAERLCGPLAARRVLVIGAGEVGALTVAALRSRKVRQVTILNRSLERAAALATEGGWRSGTLDHLDQELALADVVISATAAPGWVIDQHAIVRAAQRRDSQVLLFDLAVPRDIDPAAGALPGVRLLDVDDLQENLDEALAARQAEVPAAMAIIAEQMAQLDCELLGLEMRPLIVDLRRKAEDIRQREVERTLRHLGEVDEKTLVHIQHLSHALVNKLLHEPTVHLKSLAVAGQATAVAPTVRDLFGLDHGAEA